MFRTLVPLLTSFDGRIGRAQFWLGTLVVIVASLIIGAILIGLGLGQTTITTGTVQVDGGAASAFTRQSWTLVPWASFLLSVLTAFPAAAIGVKRRKDRGFSGIDVLGFLVASLFLQLLALVGIGGQFVAILGIALFVWSVCLLIVLGFLKGWPGTNQYGPDPLAPPTTTPK